MKSSRRLFFQAGAALAAAGITRHHARAEGTPHEWQDGRSPWPMCLDTATLATSATKESRRKRKALFAA